jgi:hypothetical protein
VKSRPTTFHATAFLGLAILLAAGATVEASAGAVALGPQRPAAISRATHEDAVYSLLSCFAKTAKRLHGQTAIAEAHVRAPVLVMRAKIQPQPDDLNLSAQPDVTNHLIDLPPPAL